MTSIAERGIRIDPANPLVYLGGVAVIAALCLALPPVSTNDSNPGLMATAVATSVGYQPTPTFTQTETSTDISGKVSGVVVFDSLVVRRVDPNRPRYKE